MPERNPLPALEPRHPSSTAVMAVADIRALLAEYGDELDTDFHERETLPPPGDDDGER